MLETARSAGAVSGALGFDRRTFIFEYFAAQVLSRLDATKQDILLRTSVLQSMTVGLAAQLTGRSEAPAVLSDLYERNLFTYCSRGARIATTYQIHKLFREFLARRVLERLMPIR